MCLIYLPLLAERLLVYMPPVTLAVLAAPVENVSSSLFGALFGVPTR